MSGRILVAEDDTELAHTLRDILGDAGYEVVDLVSSADGAVEAASRLGPDLVLMDIALSGEPDGIEAARVIRSRVRVPVVYLTARMDDATLARAKETEPLGYVPKPFAVRDLLVTVEIALRLETRLAAAERLAALGTMVAGIQHEINNPLATVIANLEYVRDIVRSRAAHDEALREAALALEDASEGAERVRRAIQDLRHFSHADDTTNVPIDLVTAVEAAARITMHAVRHHATVRRRFALTPAVLATEGQLTRVFVNLLLSAAQATGDGRAEQHSILLSTHTDAAGNAVAEIGHDGPVLGPSELEPTPGAEGLALAICQRIVASLGGRMEVESGIGTGTTFRVTLPPAPQSKASAPAQGTTEKHGARIFVVDDELAIGKALQRMLAHEHDVVIETDAQAALARLGRERFDVIFCDLMMPKLSGMDLYAALSSTAPDLAARVVFLTGGAFSPRAAEFLRAHESRCLSKPFTRDDLAAVIRGVLA